MSSAKKIIPFLLDVTEVPPNTGNQHVQLHLFHHDLFHAASNDTTTYIVCANAEVAKTFLDDVIVKPAPSSPLIKMDQGGAVNFIDSLKENPEMNIRLYTQLPVITQQLTSRRGMCRYAYLRYCSDEPQYRLAIAALACLIQKGLKSMQPNTPFSIDELSKAFCISSRNDKQFDCSCNVITMPAALLEGFRPG